MNYVWISSYIADISIVWLYFRHSDFTISKSRPWLKALLCLPLIIIYYGGIGLMPGAVMRMLLRLAIYILWIWLAEGIPLRGALYSSLFWLAVYTAFQNIFFGPYISGYATGRMDLFESHLLSQIVLSVINILLRFLFFGAVARLLPFAGMIGANFSGIAFMLMINIILTYSKTSVVGTTSDFDGVSARMQTYFILLQAALMVAVIAFEFSRRHTVEAATLQIQRTEAQALLENIRSNQTNENALRSLRHDLKNHAISLQLLLDHEDIEEAKKYLENFQAAAKTPAKTFATGNQLLDGLLTLKLEKPMLSGVRVNCTLDFRNSGFIDNFDLCVLMGNILDNAVEACEALPPDADRYISVSGGPAANCMLVKVENSRRQKTQQTDEAAQKTEDPAADGLPATTKSDRSLHGFGLRNVKAVLDRYSGSMTIERGLSAYSISLLIPRP